MRIAALIMAAGRGDRFGGELKQLAPLGGRPTIAWSVERMREHAEIVATIVVAPPGEEERIRGVVESADQVIAGGETRQVSVFHGLEALPGDITHVLIHDAARPCVSGELVQNVMNSLHDHNAVVPAVPAVDTLIRENEGDVQAILDRAHISGVQTPQGFDLELILRAHRIARSRGFQSSDDGSLVLALAEPVATVPGESTNIKITYPDDLAIAEAVLRKSQARAS